MSSLHRTAVAAAGAAMALAAVAAAPALADSVAYVTDHNVWVANPDGSGRHQVTLDGTAGSPYESPSQADDGTILALRRPPGKRTQLFRMTQSGQLLNPPVDTPAPGTGAMDARISPDGRTVAYWFETTVFDPLCPFCVDIGNQVLLSHPDRFTSPGEIGRPYTGGWPSWVSNDTIALGSGSASQWYYKLGMPQAAEWFTEALFTTEGLQTLTDTEAAPTGDRLAVVRGNHQETILLLDMNGAPPSKPSFANPQCAALTQPTGRFVDPTWSSDGRLLAWQEDDGVWTMPVPGDLADCSGFGAPALRIPGARTPDLGPAQVRPGPRPPCGNPGNPTCGPESRPPAACCAPPAQSGSARVVEAALAGTVTQIARTLRRMRIGGLLRRKRFRARFDAPEAGVLTARLITGRTTDLARGRSAYGTAGKGGVTVKLTRKGRARLRAARRVRTTLAVSFQPPGGGASTVTWRIVLRR